MSVPRLGVASIVVSISDADGFRVRHGSDNSTLKHIPADKCRADDWAKLWHVINSIGADK